MKRERKHREYDEHDVSVLTVLACVHNNTHISSRQMEQEIGIPENTVLRILKLSYVGQDCEEIPFSLVQMYSHLVYSLDLSYNCLKHLNGLNKFLNLKELILDNNALDDGVMFPNLQHLQILSLNKNNISNLELLLSQLSEKYTSLEFLSMLGNAACPDQLSDPDKDEEDYKRYRHYVLYRLPSLKFLDSSKVTWEEKIQASERGKFMKIVSPDTSNRYLAISESPHLRQSIWSPLPLSSRKIDDHTGAYGKCRYRYSGKHSEGNRFILNKDL